MNDIFLPGHLNNSQIALPVEKNPLSLLEYLRPNQIFPPTDKEPLVRNIRIGKTNSVFDQVVVNWGNHKFPPPRSSQTNEVLAQLRHLKGTGEFVGVIGHSVSLLGEAAILPLSFVVYFLKYFQRLNFSTLPANHCFWECFPFCGAFKPHKFVFIIPKELTILHQKVELVAVIMTLTPMSETGYYWSVEFSQTVPVSSNRLVSSLDHFMVRF